MFRQFFIRDRMVMTGLIILGILTVAAGFVSGRSTFQYALATDARLASGAWIQEAERSLFGSQAQAQQTLGGRTVRVIAPDHLAQLRRMQREKVSPGPRIPDAVKGQSGLLGAIDHLFAGWIQGLTDLLDADDHVSKVANFVLLDQNGQPILRDAGFQPAALSALLSSPAFQAEFHKALGLYSARIVDDFRFPGHAASEFRKLILVPVIEGANISRVYVLDVDQSSAATMSKAALVAASMMTSLLIVLGYSIPAAIAFRRIRERWYAEDQIRFLAMHDPLTGLPNRVQLEHRLNEALMRTKRHDTHVAVLCLDLDRFKDVNDTLGHQTGDALLRETANRLRSCVRETDIVARLGGDEFTLVVEEVLTPNDAVLVARRICEKLARPFEVNGHTVSISGSVGITLAPDEGVEPDVLMNNADLALYRAKNDGRNTFRFFEPEMDRVVQERRRISNDLRRALRNNELAIHYQPQFDLRTAQLTGYEALARWDHPSEGSIPPDVFIPIAEEMGLIGILGEWVLRAACRYAVNWPEDLTLAVNVSPVQLVAQDVVAIVASTLQESGFPANRLQLEVTESLLLKNTAETADTLRRLNEMGVSIALDDFGTGYSSLSYLTKYPVRKIKIDRSFVDRIGCEDSVNAVISTIVGLGKTLDVTITAEGVETEGQARFLRELGCGEVQGFLFGRPQPAILPAPRLAPQPIPVEPAPHGTLAGAASLPPWRAPESTARETPGDNPVQAPGVTRRAV